MTGGILGPFLLMFGLQRVSAVSGSLLLNLETPLTILLAVVLAREHLGLRQAGSALLILLGAGIVGQRPGDLRAEWLGVAAIAGASLSWAIDTNLSQRLALRDPVAFSRLKGFAGGTCMMAAALGRGETLPGAGVVVPALLLGWMSYGLSAVLFVLGLRAVGSSRMAAYFATAPFLGALVAIPVLGDGHGDRGRAAAARGPRPSARAQGGGPRPRPRPRRSPSSRAWAGGDRGRFARPPSPPRAAGARPPARPRPAPPPPPLTGSSARRPKGGPSGFRILPAVPVPVSQGSVPTAEKMSLFRKRRSVQTGTMLAPATARLL